MTELDLFDSRRSAEGIQLPDYSACDGVVLERTYSDII